MSVDLQSQKKIEAVAQLLKTCQSILFITGAGISVDSGLPTYRGIGGLYNGDTTDEGIPIEVVLAGETFNTHPAITWKYIAKLEKRCRSSRFNRAHEIIAEMEKHFPRVWVLTQNIDGFHHEAGSQKVIDIHGNMHNLRCTSCLWRATVKDYSQLTRLPLCPDCGAVARPDIVFFGEILPGDKVQILHEQLEAGFDIYFSIGTTSVFPYIQQPMLDAQRLHRPTVEINPQETEISHLANIKISQGATVALEEIWQVYQG